MGRGYYGVPGTAPDFEDENYYYEYEPILTKKDDPKQQQNDDNFGANLLVFIMAFPFLPIWSALGFIVHTLRIAAVANRDPEKTMRLQEERRGFFLWFLIGVVMYILVIPRLLDFYYSVPF